MSKALTPLSIVCKVATHSPIEQGPMKLVVRRWRSEWVPANQLVVLTPAYNPIIEQQENPWAAASAWATAYVKETGKLIEPIDESSEEDNDK